MFSVTTPTQIRNNQLNKSTAKHHWSFSKSPRFKDPNPNCKKVSYEPRSTLSNRRASIGTGNRSAFFDGIKDSVDPTMYNMSTSFDLKKTYCLKGYNFGYNRDDLNFSNYLNAENTPAPNKYIKNESQVKSSRAYSLRAKTAYPKNYFIFSDPEAEKSSKDPGPGKYELIDSIGNKYMTTKHINAGNTSTVGSQRFHDVKLTPGPGDYIIEGGIQPDGKCLLSTMRGSGRRAIMHEKRQLKLNGNKYTPGPGTYRQPSDFGHYEKPVRPHTARK